jgi:hypothetical protein
VTSPRKQFLKQLARANNDMGELFRVLGGEVGAVVRRHGNVDGTLDRTALTKIKREALPLVTRTFLTMNAEGDMVPFEVVNGVVVPRSVYMRVFWRHVRAATRIGVDEHNVMMRRKLVGASDVLAVLERGTVNPLAYAAAVREMGVSQKGLVAEAKKVGAYQPFKPDPLWKYDPLHQFVYGSGTPYRLSDRIWRTAAVTRQRLDAVLERGVTIGKSAVDLAADVERFLQPGRIAKRTYAPYGKQFMPPSGASYDAMRLARTEITAARHRAGYVSANLNPFVYQYRRRLSNAGTACQVCVEIAENGPYAKDNFGYMPPSHSHCMCYVVWETIPRAVVVDGLRAEIADERAMYPQLVTPVLVDRLVEMLLAEVVPGMWEQMVF